MITQLFLDFSTTCLLLRGPAASPAGFQCSARGLSHPKHSSQVPVAAGHVGFLAGFEMFLMVAFFSMVIILPINVTSDNVDILMAQQVSQAEVRGVVAPCCWLSWQSR